MAYTTINKGSSYFNTKLYTGTGATQSITGVGFQPDLTWLKHRDNPTAYSHQLYDAVRGAGNYLVSNTTAAENDGGSAPTDALTSFDSDGFSLGANAGINQNTINHVSWNWLANGAGSSNTDGSITSTVSANTTSGFSIVKWSGTGTTGTIGHGLGVAPKFIILKCITNGTYAWLIGNDGIGWTKYLTFSTDLAYTDTTWNNTAPTSSVFSVGSYNSTNGSGENFIAYCFAEKKGFSKFGSYTGNGNADGTFIYLGFRPAWFLWKRYDSADSWNLVDSKRAGYNVKNYRLFPNTTAAEDTQDRVDLVSNGVKIRTSDPGTNASGGTYIYMAFAEHPLVSSTGTPCTAR